MGGPAAAGAILAQLQPAGLAYEGLGRMEGDGWSWGWNAGLLLRLGDAARVGVSYRSAVRHDLEGQVGSAVSAVPLNFEDTWRAGLGVNCRLDDRRTLRLGTAYDVTPVQDEHRTPRLPDQDRVWAAAGLEWKIGAKAALDVGYAHLFVGEATSDLPNQETPTSAPSGLLVGEYSAKVNVFSVQFRVGF